MVAKILLLMSLMHAKYRQIIGDYNSYNQNLPLAQRSHGYSHQSAPNFSNNLDQGHNSLPRGDQHYHRSAGLPNEGNSFQSSNQFFHTSPPVYRDSPPIGPPGRNMLNGPPGPHQSPSYQDPPEIGPPVSNSREPYPRPMYQDPPGLNTRHQYPNHQSNEPQHHQTHPNQIHRSYQEEEELQQPNYPENRNQYLDYGNDNQFLRPQNQQQQEYYPDYEEYLRVNRKSSPDNYNLEENNYGKFNRPQQFPQQSGNPHQMYRNSYNHNPHTFRQEPHGFDNTYQNDY